jgi:orotate phosphoribosyltransferase
MPMSGTWPASDARGPEVASLARRVNEVSRLSGSFRLRSGRISTEYFDKYQFEADPVLLADVAAAMVGLVPPGTEVLAGLELGGVPLVTALATATGLPTAFVRKEAKTYGTARLAEGTEVGGRKVAVIEDVITTGGQILSSVASLRQLGATVDAVLVVVDREEGGSRALEQEGLRLLPLLTRTELDGGARAPVASIRALSAADAEECEAVVATLPTFFSDPEALADLGEALRTETGFVALVDEEVVGFATQLAHWSSNVEITWLAVRNDHRRRGIGRLLVETVARAASASGARLLSVLTLGPSAPEPRGEDGYEGTRRFYERLGFIGVRELDLVTWPSSAALLLVRPLGRRPSPSA